MDGSSEIWNWKYKCVVKYYFHKTSISISERERSDQDLSELKYSARWAPIDNALEDSEVACCLSMWESMWPIRGERPCSCTHKSGQNEAKKNKKTTHSWEENEKAEKRKSEREKVLTTSGKKRLMLHLKSRDNDGLTSSTNNNSMLHLLTSTS